MALGVCLGEQCAHGVSEEDHWPRSDFVLGQLSKAIEIVQDAAHAARAQLADARRCGRPPMAAVVGGIHDVAGVTQRAADSSVPTGVFRHAVGDQDGGARRVACARPAPVEDLDAVRSLDHMLIHQA